MLLFDNRIRVVPDKPPVQCGGRLVLEDIRDGETVGELCARLGVKKDEYRRVLNGIGEFIGSGVLEIEWKPQDEILQTVTGGGEPAKELCKQHPHLWNVLTYETEWKVFPEYNDFLEQDSPVYEKKKFQWEIYESLLAGMLSELPLGARVLDIGGGVGREAVQLASRGCDVTVVDASPQALSTAWKHLSKVGSGWYDLAWGDLGDLHFVPEKSFEAVIALEAFCYHGDSRKALAEAAKRVEPGGWLAFSVENKPGAVMGDPSLKRKDVLRMMSNKRVIIEGDLYVEYFGRKELEGMARDAGMTDVRVEGCHYIADGVFGKFLKEEHFKKGNIKKRMHASERFLRSFPTTRNLGRAWFVAGRVE